MIQNKKVLVTGADGFIGSHLVETLLKNNCKVRAFVCYNALNSWGWLDTFGQQKLKKIDVFPGDVRDQNSVRKAMKDIDIVFHLAALIGIPFSYYAPDSYIDTNIKGTLNILQAGMEFKLQRILITSTSEVYGTAKNVPMDEEHSLQGQSPYSASKIGADKIAESFFRSFNLPVTIVRPFNTYGPRQSARAVVPTIITQLITGRREIKLGNLRPTRDMNYVKDICRGFIEIAKSNKTIGEEINICSNTEVSIEELVEKIIAYINPKAKVICDKKRFRPERSEVMRLYGDNSKIRKLTNWQPKYSLDKGIRETIKWFLTKDNTRGYKVDIYNV